METNKTGICAQVIVQNRDGKYLVVNHLKKTQHPWRFPGGKVEPIEQTKVRRKTRTARGSRHLGRSLIAWNHSAQRTTTIDGGLWRSHIFLVHAKGLDRSTNFARTEKTRRVQMVTKEELLKLDISR